MFSFLCLLFLCSNADSATYQRYGESTQYPSYTTNANLYNQNQYGYKSSYGSDIAQFPEATRYPNYKPGYSTTKPDSSLQSGFPPSYNSRVTPGYGFGQSYGYGQNTGSYGQNTGSYGSNYGSGYNQDYSQTYGQGYTSYETPFMKYNRDYCVNRSPQTGIWVDSLKGMWYGVEFIQHLAGDARVDYVQSCIVVHISEPLDRPSTETQLFHVQHLHAKFRQEYRQLRLLWDEAGQTIEYSLYFRNDSAGYWQAFNGQNGTLTTKSAYQQFSGTVQVLKAVNDHLLLNFCQEGTPTSPAQLYSVLFSRDAGRMARWEIDAVHALLQNKKLSVASRRMVCGNGAGKIVQNLSYLLISYLISYLIKSS
ncbi:uncharacterized protein LOC121729633 [Aricia agestis]|uniref:uncharacterized protein LOC121729633 n=1 Tax=Aricia agestis TaxID=91739 RepID=UPI001C201A07|nr:uncharacterized protein LOC121729633 [Aricia agestis]